MSKLSIFVLDDLDNLKEELIINMPKRYQELLKYLNNKNKLYEIFIYDNDKIIIDNEYKYKLIICILIEKNIYDIKQF